MKILYLDCGMGAAGDMMMSALSEIIPDQKAFIEKMNSIKIPKVVLKANRDNKCGVDGTHINVYVNGEEEGKDHHHHDDNHHHHHHHHTTLRDIEKIINSIEIPEKVKKNALAVYKIIAEAESHAHECKVEEIHFHEVGTMDAVADIVGVCLLMDMIKPDKVVSSPINLGSGFVDCAHGRLPVPAPATQYIVKNIPSYSGEIESELCTPTGAALILYFTYEYGECPDLKTKTQGVGTGTKNFEKPNCLYAVLGEM